MELSTYMSAYMSSDLECYRPRGGLGRGFFLVAEFREGLASWAANKGCRHGSARAQPLILSHEQQSWRPVGEVQVYRRGGEAARPHCSWQTAKELHNHRKMPPALPAPALRAQATAPQDDM